MSEKPDFEREVVFPIESQNSVEDIMAPITAPLQNVVSITAVPLRNRVVLDIAAAQLTSSPDVAIGLRIELMEGGNVVATKEYFHQ